MSLEVQGSLFSRISRVSSIFRQYDSETPSNFSVNIPQRSTEFNKLICCQILNICVPNTFYNVPSGSNTLVFQAVSAPGVDLNIVITPGQYNISEFLTAIQTQLAVAGITFTWTLDSITKKYTYTTTPKIQLTSGVDNHIAIQLGYGVDDSVIWTLDPANEAPYIPNLFGVQTVYIHSNALAPQSSNFDRDDMSATIAYIDINESFGNTCHFDNHSDSNILVYRGSIKNLSDRLDFRLRDQYGRDVQLEGGEVELVLKCYYRV